MLGEPVSLHDREEGSGSDESEEYDYENGDYEAGLVDSEDGEGEDRFFAFKCIKYAGICTPLCVSK